MFAEVAVKSVKMSNVKATIELVGNQEDVLSFIGLCAKIELLGIWGASRTIPVDVDGDGSARLRFNVEAEVKDKGKVDMIKSWWDVNKENFKKQIDSKVETHYIGE
jgi:hypothetical protein